MEPTSYCNAKCPHCPRFDITHHDVFESTGKIHPDLTLSHCDIPAIIKNLDLANLQNLSNVILEGDKGDPMMHPQIEDLIDAFCRCPSQPNVVLTTNGSIRPPSWWAKLAQKCYSNLEVVFSIDGLHDTNHLYRVGLDYDRILNNANSFIANGGRAIWKMLAFKHNHHQLAAAEQLSKTMGFAGFYSRACIIHRFKEMNQWPVITDNTKYYIEPVIHSERTVFHRAKGNKSIQSHTNENILCPNLSRGQIYINHLSQVVPCCMMHFDTELKYPGTEQLRAMTAGFDNLDLSQLTLYEILQGDFFSRTLQESFFGEHWHETCIKSCRTQIIKKMELINDNIN